MSEYTRGEQVHTPADIEYLFRAIRTDLSATLTRVKALMSHYEGTATADGLKSAYNELLHAAGAIRRAEREAEKVRHIGHEEAGW
jgi:hypothetical protein